MKVIPKLSMLFFILNKAFKYVVILSKDELRYNKSEIKFIYIIWEFITMQFTNITNSEKITYGVSFILSIITYFMLINFFDEKTTTGISAFMFFVFTYFGLYIVRKDKLVLEIHNGVLDKDIRFYLYNGNKKIDSDKIRESEDASKGEVKERLKVFLKKIAF